MILHWLIWLKPVIMTVKGIKIKVLAENLMIKTKCKDAVECALSHDLPYINKCKEALAAIKEEGL